MFDPAKCYLVALMLLAPALGQAQSAATDGSTTSAAQVSFDDLQEIEKRRIGFYAEKIVLEIIAAVNANDSGDAAGFKKHGNAVKSTADRFIQATAAVGLSEADADAVFHQQLIENFSGPLPSFLVTSNGLVGVGSLVDLIVPNSDDAQGGYVDSIRGAGEALFNN